jgi:uncharacterized metal-binding protein
MADGQTHSRINLVNGIVLTGATAFWWHPDWQTTVAVGVGCLIGWLITPDLDLVGVTYEEKRVYRFNWLVGFLWQLYWLAYSRMMPHRGLSHVPIFGTLTRVVYLLAPWLLLAYGYNWLPPFRPEWWWWLGAGFAAWALQDIVHLILDIIWTTFKINSWGEQE